MKQLRLCLTLLAFCGMLRAEPLTMLSSELVNQHYRDYLSSLESLLQSSGIAIQHRILPTVRMQTEVNNGRADIVTLVSATELGHSPMLPVKPEITLGYNYAFYRADAGYQGLKNKRVAVVAGQNYLKPFLADNNIRVTTVPNVVAAFKMVESGRVDYTFFAKQGEEIIAQNNIQNVVSSDVPLTLEAYSLAVHPDHQTLIPELSKILFKLKSQPAYRYMLKDGTLIEPVRQTDLQSE